MRGSTGLSRSRGPRHHKRAGQGHGPGTFQRPGQSKARSCGGWVDPVEGCAIGSGHDSRLTTQSERCSQEESSQPRRCSAGCSSEEEGRHVSRAHRRKRQVLAAEVGGRWSGETAQFLCAIPKARAQSVPRNLQGRMEAAWLRRWSAILACSAAGTGDAVPSVHEVLRDDSFA